jgi:succinate-semialdehyde dehydrogenase
MRKFSSQCCIGNEWIAAASKKTYDIKNPATGEVLATVPYCSAEEANMAIDSAYNAFQKYKKTTGQSRAVFLRTWCDKVLSNKEALATMMTYECGKPYNESLGEITYSCDYMMWFAGEAERIYGDIIPSARAEIRQMVIRHPVGVVAAITPWNFPAAMLMRKVSAAIAAGCTVVAKPADSTALTAMALMELAIESGMPAGVLNIIVGDSPAIGTAFCESPKVSKITFTGSTAVGRKLQGQSIGKRVTMELGGNAPFVVFEDADMDKTITGAMSSKFRNAGQTCVCANRFIVHRQVVDTFIGKLKDEVAKLKVGNGINDGINIGPLINDAAVKKARKLVDAAITSGAKMVYCHEGVPTTGSFCPPMILKDVAPTSPIWSEEIFGPVVTITPFDTEEEALHLANDTEHGLAAYVFSQDIGRCFRMMEGLQYGMVGVNEGVISSVSAPFGGVKASGMGREGSMYGTDDYTEMKYCCLRI